MMHLRSGRSLTNIVVTNAWISAVKNLQLHDKQKASYYYKISVYL
jgi:hypothetical protein